MWGKNTLRISKIIIPFPPFQHHTFPQDYRTSEMLGIFNFSRLFIDFFAKIGWAYDLKTMDEATVQRQMNRQLEKILQAEAAAQQQKGRESG